MSRAYYNEIDPFAAAWLRNLIAEGLIADGDVDERSIADVHGSDLHGYTQCHFFAGLGGWSLALRLAGWPDDRPVWTGSCPCQPFSSAGKQRGHADERHLWPEFARLIAERRPPTIFGEQVASAIGHGWLDGVFADLEAQDYSCGAIVLGAHSVGAPHIRQRLWWVADSNSAGCSVERVAELLHEKREAQRYDADGRAANGGLADAQLQHAGAGIAGVEGSTWIGRDRSAIDGTDGRMVEPIRARLEGHAGHGDDGREPRRLDADQAGSTAEAGGDSPWSEFLLIPCADGKARRIAPGLTTLAHGIPRDVVRRFPELRGMDKSARANRIGRLTSYGNAIVPQVAAEFIAAFVASVTTRSGK